MYGYYPNGLIKKFRNFKPDVIHVEQGDNAFSYFQSIILAKIFCRKARFTFFTWINWKVKRSLKYKVYWSWIEKFNLFISNEVGVGNRAAKEILRVNKFLKPGKVFAWLGVNLNFFKPVLIEM